MFHSKTENDKNLFLHIDDEKENVCFHCGRSFTRRDRMKQHIHTVHEGRKDFNCSKCNKSFSVAKTLKQHINTVHEGRKDFKCDKCNKSFTTSMNLKQHILTIHEGRKDFNCHQCNKFFTASKNLKQHIHTVHEGRKDFNCSKCKKSFTTAKVLKNHNHTVHEGHKDYKCERCNKLFTTVYNLKLHIHTVHEGRKDFYCVKCNKSFAAAKSLKKHNHTIHNVIGDYECEKSFTSHEITTQLKCETCDKIFMDKADLMLHIQSKHFIQSIQIEDVQTERNLLEKPNGDATNFKEDEIKVEKMSPTTKAKTQVEISVNGNTDNVKWLQIAKPSNSITLSNIKSILMKQPKLYGISTKTMYLYKAKTSYDCSVGFAFEIIDDDETILPLFGDKIELQCWSKILAKTQVEISVNGNTDNVKWLKITKPSNAITIIDIKPLLMRQPKMYGMSNELTYTYWVKTSKSGKVGFEHIDEDDIILPLFENKIELQCWSE